MSCLDSNSSACKVRNRAQPQQPNVCVLTFELPGPIKKNNLPGTLYKTWKLIHVSTFYMQKLSTAATVAKKLSEKHWNFVN